MKNLSAFLLCGFVLLGLSCDNSKEGPSQEWFRPTEVAVDGTTATATCLTLFNRGVLLSGSCGFVCMPVSSASGLPTITVPDPEIDGSILRCRLSSLAAETNYAIYPYVEFGTEHLEGVPTVFRTGKEPEKPDEPDPDEPDPDEPDPDEPTPPPAGRLSGLARVAEDGGASWRLLLRHAYLPHVYDRFGRLGNQLAQLYGLLQPRDDVGHVVGLPDPCELQGQQRTGR